MFGDFDELIERRLKADEAKQEKLRKIAQKYETEDEALDAAVEIATMQPGAVVRLADPDGDEPVRAVFRGWDEDGDGMLFMWYNPKNKRLVFRCVSPSLVLKL